MRFGFVQAVLVAICATGAVALPLGDPRLFGGAIALEAIFIALTILTVSGVKRALVLWVCVGVAAVVMIGNSLAPPHVQIMTTFSKPANAVLLIAGGYILQALLVASCLRSIAKSRGEGNAEKSRKKQAA